MNSTYLNKIWKFLTRPAELPIFSAKFFFIVCSSTCCYYFYMYSDLTGTLNISIQFTKIFVLNFSLLYILWYFAGFFGKKFFCIISNLCFILALIFGCVEIFTLYHFHTLFNQVFAGVVLGTNLNESKEFLSFYFDIKIFTYIAILIAIGIICLLRSTKLQLPHIFYAICALFSIGWTTLVCIRADSNPWSIMQYRMQIPRILSAFLDGTLYQVQILKDFKNLNKNISVLAINKTENIGGGGAKICIRTK
ncbi:hypothetical protein BKN38_03205 [Helicobacter sp. CLO-3]|uniref:hypothetical protein n=2 Tax=unclassified Helicobacter TaxID=2593540 RepID=UPI0008DA7EE3|nr:hypothetical protein [Helicobacter sp. CLO-3]OHU84470.1 hypothetical protein BKN38_03205 [Helicobacter sp. CLO-3]